MFFIYASFYLSKFLKKSVHYGNPFSISIEPTTSCNLRCPECPSGLRSFTRPTGMLTFDTFKSIINEIYKDLLYLTFYFQGEPYLHKHFLEMVAYAKSKKIYTSTSTNAHYLNEENAKKTILSGLDRLIISIDGTTQETYKQYRIGGKLDKVIKGTQTIVKWKKELKSNTPYIIFQFLVVKPNEHQVDEVFELAKKLGVDAVILKTAQIYDYQNGNDLIPSIEKYSRYKKNKDGSYSIKNSMENSCWKLWHSCVFTWDGKVVPCCFDKDAQYVLGDIKAESFLNIWNGSAYNQFRKKLVQSRKTIDICQNCSEGCEVNFNYDL
jgi:radical SAM protein with 4Fe4S-binding SPASM domain